MRNRGPTSLDELERAVVDMRERFLAIGEHITGLLHSLTLQIDSAPRATRASISSAADLIARTQQQLRLQMANLPANPEERYQLMRSLLQAQGGALQQLSIIVQQQTPQPIAFAPNGSAGPGEPFPAGADYDWTTAPRGAAMAGHALADEHFDYLMHDGGLGRRPAPSRPQPHQARPGQPRANRPAKARPARRKGAMAMAIVSSRMLAVVGLMLVAAVAAYLYFPLTDERRARVGSRSAAVASDDRKAAQKPAALPDASNGTAAKPRFIARLPAEEPADEATAATGSALPARIERLAERGADEPTPSTTALPPWLGAPRPRTPAPDAEQTASAIKPAAAIESAATPAEAPPRFVAVVFTHQDQAAALDAFADLRQRYPALLARRKAEAQPVEVADKGTWHRLVVLPAGSRQTATGLCDRLQAAGYDRCWVKTY